MSTRYMQFHDKKISLNICFLGYRKNFVGTQRRVRIIQGKRAIGVRVIEVFPGSFLLSVPRRFFCCSSSLLVRRWFHMWRLLCHCLVPAIPTPPHPTPPHPIISFSGASGRLYFMTAVFHGYLHLHLGMILNIRKEWNFHPIRRHQTQWRTKDGIICTHP